MRQTVIVTGGGSGIGAATARLFAQRGSRVAVWDTDVGAAEMVCRDVATDGGEAYASQVDVRDGARVAKAVDELMERWGRLDILVNNAGVAPTGPITEFTEQQWDAVIGINLKGVWLCTKHAVPAMRRSGGGTVVNIGSTAGLVGFPNLSAYCASKGGVVQLTRALAMELAPEIRVNCVCPGHTNTPLGDGFIQAQADPAAFRREFARQHPLGRLGEPGEIAEAVWFLASPASSFITGTVLPADAGFTAR